MPNPAVNTDPTGGASPLGGRRLPCVVRGRIGMITLSEAQSLAEAYLQSHGIDDVAILPTATIEKAFGWVFFYQSCQYLETGNDSFSLAGNAPLIVNRHDRSISASGTAFPLEHYVAEYEASHGGKAA
jgi:Immunity protein 35